LILTIPNNIETIIPPIAKPNKIMIAGSNKLTILCIAFAVSFS